MQPWTAFLAKLERLHIPEPQEAELLVLHWADVHA